MFRKIAMATLMVSSFNLSVCSLTFNTIRRTFRPIYRFTAIKENSEVEPPTLSLPPMGKPLNYQPDKDKYLFGKTLYFTEIGMNEILSQALRDIGKEKATSIQSSSFKTICSGKDVIIAAETGSGKTLAYLLPLFHNILDSSTINHVHYPSVVVMVPNKELCSQVHRMATEVVYSLEKYGRSISVGN